MILEIGGLAAASVKMASLELGRHTIERGYRLCRVGMDEVEVEAAAVPESTPMLSVLRGQIGAVSHLARLHQTGGKDIRKVIKASLPAAVAETIKTMKASRKDVGLFQDALLESLDEVTGSLSELPGRVVEELDGVDDALADEIAEKVVAVMRAK